MFGARADFFISHSTTATNSSYTPKSLVSMTSPRYTCPKTYLKLFQHRLFEKKKEKKNVSEFKGGISVDFGTLLSNHRDN